MSDVVSTGGGHNHPAGCGCPWCTSTVHGEPALTLAGHPTGGSNPAPISAHDVEVLRANKGTFENGYTPEDAATVLTQFDSAHVAVFWDRVDVNGDLYGDSFFAGVPTPGDVHAPAWDHHMVNDAVWAYLSDPDYEGAPSEFTSLLEPEPAHANGGELYTFNVNGSTQHAFEADPDSECSMCGCPTDSFDELCEDCRVDDVHEPGNGET